MISAIGLVAALTLLIVLTMRGMNILIAAPLCAILVALSSGLLLLPAGSGAAGADFVTTYMTGFTSFLATWFFMFLLGAIFGEVMAATGAAQSIAKWVVDTFGIKHALLAVVVACALLTYGGVSVFIVAFSVYPMAISLFRDANLPRRFLPAAIAFGSVTFTMTSAGSPEIQNIIPIEYLGTTAYAGWQVSLVIAIFMAFGGYLWLNRMVKQAQARGEGFDLRDGDAAQDAETLAHLPNPFLSLVPLFSVWAIFFWTQDPYGKFALIWALGGGALVAALIGYRARRAIPAALSSGAVGAVVAITNTCAVVGFGSVAKASPAFESALIALQSLPGDPLIGAAIAVTVIAGLTGSASGGQTIALPLIAPTYLEMGASPAELHRVVAIASGALDSLPHNGYVVTTVRAICGETHASAYAALGKLTVIVPMIGLLGAIGLFVIF